MKLLIIVYEATQAQEQLISYHNRTPEATSQITTRAKLDAEWETSEPAKPKRTPRAISNTR